MKKLYILILAVIIAGTAYGQKATDNQNMNFDVSSYESVRIHNYKGNVNVTSKQGSTLSLKVTRTLTAKTSNKLDAAKQEVYLDTTVVDGEFIVFLVAPNKHFKMDDDGGSFYEGNDWNNWSKSKIKEYGVEYEFEIDATLPPGKNIYIATHHKDVEVTGISGNTTVKSHHGNVKASTAGNNIVAKSHHGDVVVDHLSSDVKKGVYKTHHGDIKTSFPALSANANMDSHHGSYYIDFDYDHIAQRVSKKLKGGKTKYKYGGETNIKVGGGDGDLTYRTHHGDTFITKN